MAHIGFLGAGRMGRPMMQRLIAAGHTVRVHYRFDWEKEDFTEQGAEVTTDIADLPRGADAVVVNLFSDDQVRELVLAPGGLVDSVAPGTIVILHTTSSPRTSELIEARLAEVGALYVDAAVSGGPHDIAAGEITLFVGGGDEAWAKAERLLQAYGNPIFHLGPVGTGMKVKLLNNAAFGAHVGVVSVLSDLARKLDLDEKTLYEAMSHGSGNSAVIGMVKRGGSAQAFSESTAEFVDKDVHTAQRLLGDLDASLEPFATLYQAGRDIRRPDPEATTGQR
ncbi:NAD-binding protein [Nocardioides sp. dk4132]|uniref:NAD(P)-dependent oxidoreductase n=1 Tax=unclassified Nocardioides TaxID=2615069 RepID=UPI0012950B30|nr:MULTISPECIES: NAD(P)-binding domain-containing protein [unclassified Nocardioides]MQW77619.1 NAD-binding protein [Nocardioides sp. dk4132]QGA06145.1 NAD-binding protein [Nocardioides sp. dk884]